MVSYAKLEKKKGKGKEKEKEKEEEGKKERGERVTAPDLSGLFSFGGGKKKIRVLVARKVNGVLKVVKVRKISPFDTFVRIEKDRTMPIDPDKCLFQDKGKDYILLDIDSGQLTIGEPDSKKLKPSLYKLLDDLVSVQVVRQIGKRIDEGGAGFGGYLVPILCLAVGLLAGIVLSAFVPGFPPSPSDAGTGVANSTIPIPPLPNASLEVPPPYWNYTP